MKICHTQIVQFRADLADYILNNDIIVVHNGNNNREKFIVLSLQGKEITLEDMQKLQDWTKKILKRNLKECEELKKYL